MRKENEELIKSMPDPEQPPGHRKLPDEEKEKTLTLLKESKLKYLQLFFKLIKLNFLTFKNLIKHETNYYPK
jgi:hypothetical protein